VKILGRKGTFMVSMVVAIVCTAAFYFLRPTQILPIFGLGLVYAISSGPIIALLMTNYADSADYGEFMKSRRATGLIFSACILTQKAGWAFAGWLGLDLQASSGFVANQEQTPQSLRMLVLLMSLIPAAFGVLTMICFAFYPLHEGRVAEIGAELNRRRSAAQAQ
jgi:GPH family glycoside/pentoside/hexuronide:cation symporter